MSGDELLDLLRQRVAAEGGVSRFAENHDISQGYVSNVLYCGNKPGPKIALALGFKMVRTYEPIKGG